MEKLSPDFGQHVNERLSAEVVIWLSTVDRHGRPQPRPVWFWWDGESILIYSRPNTHKLNHIQNNPNVSLNFDGDGLGGDIVVFQGVAILDENAPDLSDLPEYISKYKKRMENISGSVENFNLSYSIAIRVGSVRLRE